jgi:hypothetical protein
MMMSLPLQRQHPRACGADDDECFPVLNPVLSRGQFGRTLLGQFWSAPKHRAALLKKQGELVQSDIGADQFESQTAAQFDVLVDPFTP